MGIFDILLNEVPEPNPQRGVIRSGHIDGLQYDETEGYYWVRIQDPKQYIRIRTQKIKEGILFRYGVRRGKGPKGGKTELQSIGFSKDYFTIKDIKKWLKEYGYIGGKNPKGVFWQLRFEPNEINPDHAIIESYEDGVKRVREISPSEKTFWKLYAIFHLRADEPGEPVPLTVEEAKASLQDDDSTLDEYIGETTSEYIEEIWEMIKRGKVSKKKAASIIQDITLSERELQEEE